MKEKAFLFGKTKSLTGIVTAPPSTATDQDLPAVIILNSGIAHRVGTSRLYVRMARRLAKMGFLTFRFDFSGVGDSKARTDNLTFEKSAVSETQEAMDFLCAERGIQRFILTGICAGGSIAFRTACLDERVVGIVLMNVGAVLMNVEAVLTHSESPQDDGLHTYLRDRQIARFFWKRALFNPRHWVRAFTGKLNYRRLITAVGFPLKNIYRRKTKLPEGVTEFVDNLGVLHGRGVDLLFIYSESDPGLDYFHIALGDHLEELRASRKLDLTIIAGADHTFTLLENQDRLLDTISEGAYAMGSGIQNDEALVSINQ